MNTKFNIIAILGCILILQPFSNLQAADGPSVVFNIAEDSKFKDKNPSDYTFKELAESEDVYIEVLNKRYDSIKVTYYDSPDAWATGEQNFGISRNQLESLDNRGSGCEFQAFSNNDKDIKIDLDTNIPAKIQFIDNRIPMGSTFIGVPAKNKKEWFDIHCLPFDQKLPLSKMTALQALTMLNAKILFKKPKIKSRTVDIEAKILHQLQLLGISPEVSARLQQPRTKEFAASYSGTHHKLYQAGIVLVEDDSARITGLIINGDVIDKPAAANPLVTIVNDEGFAPLKRAIR